MAITYPLDCDTPRKRTEYVYRAQELLRRVHNGFSKWFHEGLTEVQYNLFPLKVKNKYPYVPQISQEDWDRFKQEDFEPRSNKVCQAICVQRAYLKESVEWTIDVGDI